MTCQICFEVHPFEKMKEPRCGHYFCEICWTGQVLVHHYVIVCTLRIFVPNAGGFRKFLHDCFSFVLFVSLALITLNFVARNSGIQFNNSY